MKTKPDEVAVLEAFRPMLPAMARWWLRGEEIHGRMFDRDLQFDLGKSHRALFIQRMALREMRTDPAVVGRMRPREGRGKLEFLHVDGDSDDGTMAFAVLLKKITLFAGKYRTGGWWTGQQYQRREGSLFLGGVELYPLVVGPVVHEDADGVQFTDRILFGHEGLNGMTWRHPIYRRGEEGGQLVEPIAPLPMFPAARITLRNPITPALPDVTAIGTDVPKRKEQKRRRDAERRRDNNQSA